MKDPNRYSYSRFKTFQICPRKEYYNYQEAIEPRESESQLIGSLFHECLESHYTGFYPQDAIDTYHKLSDRGEITAGRDLLEYVLKLYVDYYAKEDAKEEILMVEHRMEEKLDGDDYLEAQIDRLVRKDGYVILRDTKTTTGTLKWVNTDVGFNQQLLFYLPYAEKELGEPVNVIEIDEVRIAKLEQPPLLKNGRPTTDKSKLGLVLYEDYRNVLESMGLADDADYQPILDWLEKRGHPLFRRVRAQLLELSVIDNNLEDMYSIYLQIKLGRPYRNHNFMCETCQFKQLCKLDYFNPSEASRDGVVNLIKKSSTTDE